VYVRKKNLLKQKKRKNIIFHLPEKLYKNIENYELWIQMMCIFVDIARSPAVEVGFYLFVDRFVDKAGPGVAQWCPAVPNVAQRSGNVTGDDAEPC